MIYPTHKTKLNVGCGNDIRPDYLNLDVAPLPGVDIVHNLHQFPWPLSDDQFEEIIAIHVLEHLSDTIRAMEELWRISKEGGLVQLRVPYWNSWDAVGDPTHVKTFHQGSFDFFDPRKSSCKTRPYYSKARFHIEKIYFWRPLFRERGWIRIGNPFLKGMMRFFAKYLNNIICVLEMHLRAIKNGE